ncbi:CIC11C00000001112 [Sungouiella intermedia]|uniref:CIC11C00000001112 n=1 Tax=Sungouiella intermedia TaxID=45354 RepID=A0A1L0BMJ9_9ASCO|nr:CIC11C00000001112 [[Candida] intermedia]
MAINNINAYFLEIDRIQFQVFEKINEITSLNRGSQDQSESLDERRGSIAKSANGLIRKIPGLLDVISIQIKQESHTLIEKNFLKEKLELYKEKVSYLKLKLKESQLVAYSLESELTHKQRLEEYVKDANEVSSDMREELFAGRSHTQATDTEKPINEQILTQNQNITSSLKLTKQLMTMSVMQTELNIDGLDQQSKDLNKLNDKLVNLEGVLLKSKQIVKFIEKQDKRDKRRIYLSIGFLLICCAWVLWRRVLKMPVKILLWSLLKFFGVLNWIYSKYPSDKLGIQVTSNELASSSESLASSQSVEHEFSTLIDLINEETQFSILPIKEEVEEETEFSILPINEEDEEEITFSILPIDVETQTELTENVLKSTVAPEASEKNESSNLGTVSEEVDFEPIDLDKLNDEAQLYYGEHSPENEQVADDSNLLDDSIEMVEDISPLSLQSDHAESTVQEGKAVVEESDEVPVEEDGVHKFEEPEWNRGYEEVIEEQPFVQPMGEESVEEAVEEAVEIPVVEPFVRLVEQQDEEQEVEEQQQEEQQQEDQQEEEQQVEVTAFAQVNDKPIPEEIEESVEASLDNPVEAVQSTGEIVEEFTLIESIEQKEEPMEQPILQAEEPILQVQEPNSLSRDPVDDLGNISLDESTEAAHTTVENAAEKIVQEAVGHSEYIQDVGENQEAQTWEATHEL